MARAAQPIKVSISENAERIPIASLRPTRVRFDDAHPDVTRAGEWRRSIEAAGIKRMSVAGTGAFEDSTADVIARQAFFDGRVKHFHLVIPDFGTVEGPFQISALEFSRDHNGEVTIEIAIESAGELIFRA